MFANAFQNGHYFQVWDAKVNPQKNIFYKQLIRAPTHPSPKTFDKQAKCYLFSLLGQHSKVSLPADDLKHLSLNQRYLVIQLFVPVGSSWWCELGLSDLSGTRHRINLTTTYGKQQVKYFSFRYPMQNLMKGCWVFLGVDVYSFMDVFKDAGVFRALEHITIGGCCKLRRIFTMKEFVEWEVPKGYWMAQDIPQKFQLVQYRPQPSLILPVSQIAPNSPPLIKKEQGLELSRSNVSQRSEGKFGSMYKSEAIVNKARNRLQQLQQEEERIISRSKQLDSLSSIRKSKEKYLQISVSQQKRNKQKFHPLQRQSQIRRNSREQPARVEKTKLPAIEKNFKEDIALNEWQQSSNFTEQHMHTKHHLHTPLPESREVIEEDKWSSEEGQQSRQKAISEAIESHPGPIPSTIITSSSRGEVVVRGGESLNGVGQVQLIYDEMVGCYYHPQSHKYYDIQPPK